MTAEFYLDCPICGQNLPAEVPPCTDGHGDECPDRICTRCGTALFVNPFVDIVLPVEPAAAAGVRVHPEPMASEPVSPATQLRPMTDPDAPAVPNGGDDAVKPEVFRAAVASLTSTRVRPEVRVEPLRPPQRLAPWSYAISADVRIGAGDDLATGRLVLLHDPDGVEAWDGVLRLVAFASAELDPQMGVDPMLPAVGWSWLTGALDDRSAAYRAAGGTVTQTTSTRFGDLVGPSTTVALELRASWTADSEDMAPHLSAFIDLLCLAAGLPPEGVTLLSPS